MKFTSARLFSKKNTKAATAALTSAATTAAKGEKNSPNTKVFAPFRSLFRQGEPKKTATEIAADKLEAARLWAHIKESGRKARRFRAQFAESQQEVPAVEVAAKVTFPIPDYYCW